jgi:hypothetical protein
LVVFSSSDVTVTKGAAYGGLAGYLEFGSRISDCWSRVIVTGGIDDGGLTSFPNNNPGTAGRCYTIVDETELWVYPTSDSRGTALEDEKPEQWFYEVTYGWDFDKFWVMGGDGYPRLRGVDVGY